MSQEEAIDVMAKNEGVVEWNAGNFIFRLMPGKLGQEQIEEPNAILMEVDLMLLDLNDREQNYDCFLVLHQLNSINYMTTGIMAFITGENMLSMSKMVDLSFLNEKDLVDQMAKMIQAAEELYERWEQLTKSIASTMHSENIQITTDVLA